MKLRVPLITAVVALTLSLGGCTIDRTADSPTDMTEITQSAQPLPPSTYEIHPVDPDFYERWELKDLDSVIPLDNSNQTVDENGVLIVHRAEAGNSRVYHPVAYENYAFLAIQAYQLTGTQAYLDRAIANANALLDGATREDGALWFEYGFPFAFHSDPDQELAAPWRSGMAQGQALGLFSKLYELTDEQSWLDAADATFPTLTLPDGSGKSTVLYVDELDNLWIEEYVGSIAPKHVINGHIYALFGIAEYYAITGSELARDIFNAGATTVLNSFDSWRVPDGISWYCADPYCAQTNLAPPSYHRGVTLQLVWLAKMTGDSTFQQYADLLSADYVASGVKEW